MLISTKTLGSKKPLFADFSVPLPPGWDDDGGDGGKTLRDLIEEVVRHEVDAFKKRQADRQFLRALTAAEIEKSVDQGKVEMGGSDVQPQNVDVDDAIASALVAFEDGLYLVIVDEKQYKDLDEAVFLTADSRLTFVRLTMLSGL
jgi:ribosomal protein S9